MEQFLTNLGIKTNRTPYEIHVDSPDCFLIERTVAEGHGQLTEGGSLAVKTGKHTGRSANDRFIVKSPTTENSVWWENNLHPMTPEDFKALKSHIIAYINEANNLYITERSVGSLAEHNVGARLISTHPNHALFTKYLFREKMHEFNDSDFTILHAPELKLDPKQFNTRSETVVVTCFDTNTTLICGTLYAGEIKKSMFSVLNYKLPENNILPMHSGSNKLISNKEVSIFFGLSGTGKTTLSTDEGTLLIGDDEHGMSENGVFNFEGGCYAKTFKLSSETEPSIYKASNRFGSLLENVVINPSTGRVDYFDKSLSENGRSSYPLSFIDDIETTSKGDLPKHIFFLTADAFGVLPPISKLTKEQAMFYFVLGYTAKLAGTEIGVKEPQATFSPCFGAPFMLRHPSVYAKLLGHYLDKYKMNVWLVNTGWTGGGYGTGQRFPLHVTRQIIRRIQAGEVNNTPMTKDSIFGLEIPDAVKDVPKSMLSPEQAWENKEAYLKDAKNLASSFHKQMKKFGDFYNSNIKGAPIYND